MSYLCTSLKTVHQGLEMFYKYYCKYTNDIFLISNFCHVLNVVFFFGGVIPRCLHFMC